MTRISCGKISVPSRIAAIARRGTGFAPVSGGELKDLQPARVTCLAVAQLKVTQEVITLSVFAPFAVLYLNELLKLDYFWAGLCLLGAVYFIFRG